MKSTLKSNLSFLFAMLFAFIILVWALFYVFISGNIYDNTEKQLNIFARQIVSDLSAEFDTLERVSYNLSQRDDVKRFVSETGIEARFALARDIGGYLRDLGYSSTVTDNVIIYNEAGEFYRFGGKLPNSSCSYLGGVVKKMSLPEHISIRLERVSYIGYATRVSNADDNTYGVIVMLIEEEKLTELFYNYAPDNALFFAIAAGGTVIAANAQPFADYAAITSDPDKTLIKKHIGATPFEIIVGANAGYIKSSTYYFSVATVITVISLCMILIVFARIQSKRFFIPLSKIMRNIEELESYNSKSPLPPSESEDFDGLIDNINDMLYRLDKKNEEVMRAEVERQKALIFSLKKQINAHFTINTLNTIKILVEQSELDNAATVIDNLSGIIRYAYNKDEFINVWDELSLLSQYVSIMNIRYNNKLELHLDADDRLMNTSMPRMLLQPLIENSIVHGFKHMESGCVIDINAQPDGDIIRITVTDNGHGMDEQSLGALREKIAASGCEASTAYETSGIDNIALINIRNRLLSYYGGEFGLDLRSDASEGGLCVTVEFPLV